MLTLQTYLSEMTLPEREEFAEKCGTSWGHMRNVMYGYKSCSPALAVLIEKHSRRKVRRSSLRDDWQAIWPDLSKRAAA